MKKKILLLTLTSTATLVTSFAILAATRGVNTANLLTAEKIHPGTITIDINDEDISTGNSYNVIKSEAGNPFAFNFEGITKDGGVFKIAPGSRLENYTLINGITELRFVTPNEDQDITIKYKLNDYAWEYDEKNFEVNGGGSYYFSDYNPGYFRLENNTSNDFSFSRLTICYECVADVPEIDADNLANYGTIGEYSVSARDCLFAETGADLDEVSLNGCYLEFSNGEGKNEGISINSELVEELNITYEDSVTDKVLEGKHSASVSFKYHGVRYTRSTVNLFGYDHLGFSTSDVNFNGPSEFLIESSDDTIPNEMSLSASGDILLLDSAGDEIDHFHGTKHNILLTLEMISKSDTNRFTSVGNHEMTVTYEGKNYKLGYTIYDPSVNNIRNIWYDNFEVIAGTSTDDFLALAASKEAYIDYYNYDESLPSSVYLEASNFSLAEGMFDNPGYVEVPVTYSTYSGTINVYVRLEKGNLVKTYTNEDGVYALGLTAYSIAIYDNGACEFNPGDNNTLYAYEKDGSILMVHIYDEVLRFTVDDANNTFEKYIRTDGLVHTLQVDLSALGGGSDLYDGYLYNDYTVGIDIESQFMESPYTVDPEDDNTIYFNLNGYYDCVGVINTETYVMVVTIDSKEPEKEGLIMKLTVDFSALGAPSLYDGFMYDDGTIIFNIGTTVTCTYTVDPENENIIYFEFMDYYDCTGTINPETKTMVVTGEAKA